VDMCNHGYIKKNLFSQFMWKSMFIFRPAFIRTEVRVFPPITMHYVIMSEGQSFFERSFQSVIFSFTGSFLFLFLKSVNKRGVASGFLTVGVFGGEKEYLVWNTAAASYCWNTLVCPASDQVSIPKSGFQIASPPLFFFIIFSSCFEDEAFCVSTGYSSLWCPFSPV